MNINLVIEQLVLEGLDASAFDREAIGVALQHELTRLLAAREPQLGGGFNVERVDAAPLALRRDAGNGAVGEGLARTIYGQLRAAPAGKAPAGGDT